MESAKGRNQNQFIEEVFPQELKTISERRQKVGVDVSEAFDDKPNVDNSLKGLSLSGGGIRSATFSLGVIQGLAKHGWLKHIDYLSTVSGGGYIGSCLSSVLNNPKASTDYEKFPFKYTTGSTEPTALTHLRNFSSYLMPGGILGRLRLPNLLLRGVVLNLFVFLPFIMMSVVLVAVFYEFGPLWDQFPLLIMPLITVFVIMSVAFPFAVKILGKLFSWRQRNYFELALTVPLLLAIIVALAMPLLNLTRLAIEHDGGQLSQWLVQLGRQGYWSLGILLLLVFCAFGLAGKASENVGRIFGKVVLLILGVLGPAVIFLIFLMLCLKFIDSPFLPLESSKYLDQLAKCQQSDQGCGKWDVDPKDSGDAVTPLSPREFGVREEIGDLYSSLIGLYGLLFEPDKRQPESVEDVIGDFAGRNLNLASLEITTGKMECAETDCAGIDSDDWRADRRIWGFRPKDADSPTKCDAAPNQPTYPVSLRERFRIDQQSDCYYLVRGSSASLRILGAQPHQIFSREGIAFIIAAIFLWLFNRYFLDINITSPHGFYRDRLSKAFLIDLDDEDEILPTDDVKMSQLNQPGSKAPYHLVNVALNLQGSSLKDLRGRESDFFIFSKHYTGGEITGYAPTEVMEHVDSHLNLGTAMAISGAAAAPNMGRTTNRSLSFIMTLLNIRLGYWLPNPAKVEAGSWYKRMLLGGARPALIWREALGRINAKTSHVNVSDGGHIENLAVYELLRRRCKFIVAVDGEHDPEITFNGLVTVMRFARIDMGIEIDFSVGSDSLVEGDTALDNLRLRRASSGERNSLAHWALADINYGNGEVGHLLYIKLSVTGDEPEYIRAYRKENPAYPHESTADQFFSEAQFEAYRALGEHICEGMLKDVERLGGFANLGSSTAQ
ncbi:hypothetical protein EYC98_16670 [Halieaceae bacterium IMCC14734]|uniref:PNPLA domain-containing protein n=1 Tax=Candidatus Litorirhabdus singularis TaxID=2518993 RepID=A0ABT3TJK7_9GAMM|nr:patatin-like phospholipase family protein [Candidatus Litorirhabdus singularis]MCX2982497.1 hypothetical protein [Candidatus Litorirhabdus singularis]